MMPSRKLDSFGKPLISKKGDELIRQGESDTSLYVVVQGLLKAYYLTSDGKELIKSFIQPGEIIGSLTACYLGEKSTFSLVCLEDSKLLKIPFESLKSIENIQPELSGEIIQSLVGLALKKERREYEFLCLSAPERYDLLKQRSPDLVEHLTQNDIARYLGITPVALSRIKGRQ